MLVAQFVPSAHVPPGVQLAGPGVKEELQPGGRAGGATSSKSSFKEMTAQGTGVGVMAGVDVGEGGGGVGVGVGVGVAGGVGVGDGHGTRYTTSILSTRQPPLATLQSVARRKRKITLLLLAAGGIMAFTGVLPPELPVHAGRPAIGLRDVVAIVPL
jgi:hypothetical protein